MSPANTALVRPNGQPITQTDVARARAQANVGRDYLPAQPYEAGGMTGQWFERWRTAIRSPDLEYLPYRDQIVARSRDRARNDPIAAAAISRRKNSAVGKGWRVIPKPNARALGIEPRAAAELGRQLQTEFHLYAYSHNFQCDAERRGTFGQLLRKCAHGVMADGEAVNVVEWASGEGTRYSTRLRVVDPDRLSNPAGRINDAFFRNGVESNRLDQPLRYHFRQAHPADYVWTGEAFEWIAIDRFTPWGRPQVLHCYDAERAHQSRGVTMLVQSLRLFRAFDRFSDYTLQNAAINAKYLGFVSSSAGPDSVSDALGLESYQEFQSARREWHDKNPIGDDDARFAVMPPGDDVKMATAARQVTGFDVFTRSILRLVASSLGVTYEEMSMDYSQTNYSSARAALIHAQAETSAMQGMMEAQIVHPFYVAFLEEAFDRGYVEVPKGAPDFYDAVDAYAQARWIGPTRGYIDPVKEILAAAARMEAGITTLEDECAADGAFWEDKMYQRADEQDLAKQLGLPSGAAALAQSIQDTKNPAKQAPSPSDDEGVPEPEDTPPKGAPPADARFARIRELAQLAAELSPDERQWLGVAA